MLTEQQLDILEHNKDLLIEALQALITFYEQSSLEPTPTSGGWESYQKHISLTTFYLLHLYQWLSTTREPTKLKNTLAFLAEAFNGQFGNDLEKATKFRVSTFREKLRNIKRVFDPYEG